MNHFFFESYDGHIFAVSVINGSCTLTNKYGISTRTGYSVSEIKKLLGKPLYRTRKVR